MRRDSLCSLTTPKPPSQPASEEPDDTFRIDDFALFHHFTTVTAHIIATDDIEASPWRNIVPGLATKHPYLLHAILAVAAVHLGVLNPDKPHYQQVAAEHQAKSIVLFKTALSNHSSDSAAPLFSTSALFSSFYFATSRDPASLLFSTDPPGPPVWVLPSRGSAAIFLQHKDSLANGPMGGMLHGYLDMRPEPGPNPSDRYLTELQERLKVPPEEETVMKSALKELRACFAISDGGGTIRRKVGALRYLSAVQFEFLEMLGEKRQRPLILMAFWCVLLHRLDSRWWLHRPALAQEILGVIKTLLTTESLELIQWPIQVMDSPSDFIANGS